MYIDFDPLSEAGKTDCCSQPTKACWANGYKCHIQKTGCNRCENAKKTSTCGIGQLNQGAEPGCGMDFE